VNPPNKRVQPTRARGGGVDQDELRSGAAADAPAISPHERRCIEDLNAIGESLVELPEPKPKT
jgi:hypothetical protein